MNELFRRLRYLLNRRRFDQELAEDMDFHREMAAREGRQNFGNPLRLREEARDAWGWTWIDALFQDFRYAARMLRKSPGFTLVAILLLALGIGVNVAAFGFFNLMVLRPLPVRQPETILHFERRAPGNLPPANARRRGADNFPYSEVRFYQAHSRSLSAVLALNFDSLVMEGEEKPLHAHFVTANFFSELGGGPALGRVLDPVRDADLKEQPVAVLEHGFWERHFAADPSVIGRTIRLNGKPVTVIGVASGKFSGLGLGPPDLWLLISEQAFFSKRKQALEDFSDNGMQVQMWGRLQTGFTPRVAEQELSSLAKGLHAQYPNDTWKDESLLSGPGGRALTVRTEMYPFLAMAGALCLLILIVACSNLGGLLLARGVNREREIAIRVAVGAGRGRLIRQLLTESLVLACLGLAAGMALGSIVLRLLIAWTNLPEWLSAWPDWRVTAFAASIGLVAAILFGLTPSLQVSKQRDFRENLRALREIVVPTPAGAQVPLGQLAKIETVRAPMGIKSEAAVPNAWIYVDVKGIDVGTYVQMAMRAVNESVAKGEIKLPTGYNIFWSGEYEYMLKARQRLLIVVPLTLLIIILIIYLNTRSAIKTAIVMLAVPFSLVGAIGILALLHYNLSVAVWVGIIALAGLDAETGVVMLLYLDLAYEDWKKRGLMSNLAHLRDAIYHGAVKRVRPKAMTACVIVAGLAPILWSHGAGADVMKRIATPMIGGVITSTIMELLVYPAIYYLWRSHSLKRP